MRARSGAPPSIRPSMRRALDREQHVAARADRHALGAVLDVRVARIDVPAIGLDQPAGKRLEERLACREVVVEGAVRHAGRRGDLLRGVFLHCNRRHHSIALLALPQRKRLHHLMLEAASLAEVARAYDRARAGRLPFSLDLGQHPDPDGTLSFYVRTPSGFDFELGAGGKEIEPAGWRELAQSTSSSWGHRPTLGLKLRATANLVAAALGA